MARHDQPVLAPDGTVLYAPNPRDLVTLVTPEPGTGGGLLYLGGSWRAYPHAPHVPGTRTFTEHRIECREKGTRNPWRFLPFTGAGPYTDEKSAWDMAEQVTVTSSMYDYRVTHRTKTITTTAWEE